MSVIITPPSFENVKRILISESITQNLIKETDIEYIITEIKNRALSGTPDFGTFDTSYSDSYFRQKLKNNATQYFYGFTDGVRTIDTIDFEVKNDGNEVKYIIGFTDSEKAYIVELHHNGDTKGGKFRQWFGLSKIHIDYINGIVKQRLRQILKKLEGEINNT